MVAVHEKNGNTQGFQTPEPVAQGELGGDAGVLLIVHVPGEEQEIRALALAQIEEAAKRGERGCAQAFREIGGDVPDRPENAASRWRSAAWMKRMGGMWRS